MLKAVILWYCATVYSFDRRSPTKRFAPRSPPLHDIEKAIDALTRSLPSDLALPDVSNAIPSKVATLVRCYY